MSKSSTQVWDDIFENVIMHDQPPSQYILEAHITTKSGSTYKVSGSDFLDLWRADMKSDVDHSVMVYCKVSLDFTKIKRDVNRWSNNLIRKIEADYSKTN